MSDSPELDIRWPIGMLFAVMGALVSGYGLLHSGDAQPLGVNLNLWWGLVMLLFGLGLLWGAHRARNRQ
jgi:hypothetical protein